MPDLLGLVQQAHGGLDRWQRLTRLRFTGSAGGTLPWPRPDFLANTTATLLTRSQHTVIEPFGAPGHRGVFTPERVEILDADGTVLAERDEPRRAFEGHPQDRLWDGLQTAYFAGYAFWTYLTVPFLLSWDGVRATELEPWQENGETWLRLQVEFPDHIATHNSVQTLYFGADDHLLRRHDYSADVVAGTPLTAHYTAGYKTFDGFGFPTRRWVVRRKPDGTTLAAPVIVSLDIHSVSVS
ncbi:hypothetical protein ABZ707_05020 [Streptomyces sp. NPDC006923]|uniref:hypothetical protein n=1 Tax=Streptomyces sp. NPDC006923 TaxID=3155355 RepID=UPI0033F8F13A